MKLWLDDVRPAPFGWTWAKTLAEAKAIIRSEDVEECSLDHDLGATPETIAAYWLNARGDGHETGLDFAKWLVAEERVPGKVTIHSWNPIGAREMGGVLIDYMRAHCERDPDAKYTITVEPWSAEMQERVAVTEQVFSSE